MKEMDGIWQSPDSAIYFRCARENGSQFSSTVILRDISQNSAEIMRNDVSRKDQKVVFTGLTSARLYRIERDGAENCTVVVSQK